MKIKIDQVRTYDDAGFRRRAACLCFRSECETEILLVSSSRHHDLWIVPGGGVEPGEDPATTAIREVQEEAGVIGKLGRLLDVFENQNRNTRTYVYVLVVERLQEDYEDAKVIGRSRKWFSVDEANSMLNQHKPVQQLYIAKLIKDQDHQRRSALCTRLTEGHSFIANETLQQQPSPLTTRMCGSCRLNRRRLSEDDHIRGVVRYSSSSAFADENNPPSSATSANTVQTKATFGSKPSDPVDTGPPNCGKVIRSELNVVSA